MSLNSSIGFVKETTYGTAVTVTRFYPFDTESVREQVDKLESPARRAGTQVLQSNLSIPIFKGANGPGELPIMSKDFGFFLEHLLGAVATTGPTDTTAYTHTGTMATLTGKGLSCQINRPFHPSGTDQPFSYAGGKVADWEISASVDNEPKLAMTLDFQGLLTATGLASPSYTAGLEMLSWAHANSALTIGGTAVPISSFTLKCNNGLKLDRYYVQGSGLKSEPVADAYRDLDWEVVADFSSLTQYNRFKAANNAGQYAQVILTLAAPTLITGAAATYPTLVITIPAARFDMADIENGDTNPSSQTLGGKVRYDGTNSPVSVAYTTGQATP